MSQSKTQRSRAMYEYEASRMLKKGPDDLSKYDHDWICRAYAQAKMVGAKEACEVDRAVIDASSPYEDSDQGVWVATCDLLDIEIPEDYCG